MAKLVAYRGRVVKVLKQEGRTACIRYPGGFDSWVSVSECYVFSAMN